MTDLVLGAASDAFLDVGVVLALVALVVLALGDRVGRAARLLRRRPALGPLVGAVLGVAPGCSGALVVVPLYVRGQVSPGTVVATLLATTGDSAWALWAAAPTTAAGVHAVTLTVGAAAGVLVDRSPLAAVLAPGGPRRTSLTGAPAGRASRLLRAAPRPLPRTVRRATLLALLASFWVSTGAGAAWALGITPVTVAAGPSAGQLAGGAGFLACVALLVRARRSQQDGPGPDGPDPDGAHQDGAHPDGPRQEGPHQEGPQQDLATPGGCACPGGRPGRVAVLDRAASQAAGVVVWVGVAYLALALAESAAGPAAAGLHLDAGVAVLAGVAVGALPGCGLQIAWTGLHLDGAVPFAGLLANALAQDGDALLPLLVLRRRAALRLTAATTVPALLCGGAVAVLG